MRQLSRWYYWCQFVTFQYRTTNDLTFAEDIFKWIVLNENVWISIKMSLKFVPQGPINNIPALVQIMASRRPGDKPLSWPMMVKLPTHIRVTRPQWVKLKQCIWCTCSFIQSQWRSVATFTVVSGRGNCFTLASNTQTDMLVIIYQWKSHVKNIHWNDKRKCSRVSIICISEWY